MAPNQCQPIIVGINMCGQRELWVEVHPNGRVIMHSENGGDNMARHGLKDHDRRMSISDFACLDEDVREKLLGALAVFGFK